MAGVEVGEDGICVDAGLIAEGLGIEPSTVQEQMREGKITSLCEQGIGRDAGRYRLTFFRETHRFRLVIDREGNILRRTVQNSD